LRQNIGIEERGIPRIEHSSSDLRAKRRALGRFWKNAEVRCFCSLFFTTEAREARRKPWTC